jgi:hypothetical protein
VIGLYPPLRYVPLPVTANAKDEDDARADARSPVSPSPARRRHARIRATAAPAIGPRRMAALVLAFDRLVRVENRYLC